MLPQVAVRQIIKRTPRMTVTCACCAAPDRGPRKGPAPWAQADQQDGFRNHAQIAFDWAGYAHRQLPHTAALVSDNKTSYSAALPTTRCDSLRHHGVWPPLPYDATGGVI